MTVRNEEKKAFRDLTPEEMGEIASAIVRGEVEYWSSFSRRWMTIGMAMGGIDLNAAYRTRPRQLVIPWEVIRPEYKWAAMDEDKKVWFFAHNPKIDGDDNYWSCGGDFCQSALNINTTGIDWRDSLTERPEGV